jgi:formylglycine-generating enzyme required for sulfatase activity
MKRNMITIGLLTAISILAAACSSPNSNAGPAPGATNYISPNIGKMVYIPSGTFQYDENRSDTAKISAAFHMSENDITRAQFTTVTGLADPSLAENSTGTGDPVQQVNWYHAIYFCNMLSIKEGLTPVYSVNGSTKPANWLSLSGGMIPLTDNAIWDAVSADWSANGYRLPTEMEWMWAAIGADKENPGHLNIKGYRKSFAGSTGANNVDDYAWTTNNSGNSTHPAGTRLTNELGLFDMSGNVWQWCWDWYEQNTGGPLGDYRGGPSGSDRVIRGGSWYDSPSLVMVAFRYFPNIAYNFIGFRVVRP